MFTIIIPLYNKALYIEKTIQSVLAQTYQEFELIVVDDGSIDNSLQIVQQINKLTNQQINIISQQNSGVSTARNNGVKVAKYDYITFLDADDWWEPTFLQEMAKLINNFLEAGIYGSNYFYIKNKQKRIINVGVDKDFQSGYINYFEAYAKTLAMPLWTGAVVLRKDVFNEMQGFKPHLKLGEDFDLWIRIALKYPVVFLNKLLSNYNQDVDLQSRGVVKDKIYEPSTFITFHLNDYIESELVNHNVKILFDKLRCYSLLRYRIQNKYPELVKKEIKKVDFRNVDTKYFFYYHAPRFVIRCWFYFLSLGAKIKNVIRSI